MQFARSNGICTNNIIVRILFKLIQIVLFLALALLFIGVECGLVLPIAGIVWVIGWIHNRRTNNDCGLEIAEFMLCWPCNLGFDDD
jgi:hypothetical protein